MALRKEKFDKPQVGKVVSWLQICPMHKRQDSPFASLCEDDCLNCTFVEKHKTEGVLLGTDYCRYPAGKNEEVRRKPE